MTPRPPAVTLRFDAFVTGLAVTGDGRQLGVGLGDGSVQLLDLGDLAAEPNAWPVHQGACLALVHDVDPACLLSGGDDGRLSLVRRGSAPVTLGHRPGRMLGTLDASPAARLRALAVGRTVELFGADGEVRQILGGHPGSVTALAFDPSGQRLAVGHKGGATIWAGFRRGWQAAAVLKGGSVPTRLGWSPDGRFLIAPQPDPTVQIWRLADGAAMPAWRGQVPAPTLAWFSRGRLLCLAGAGRALVAPLKAEGLANALLTEHGQAGDAPVTHVAAHPLRPMLALAQGDGRLQLADLTSGTSRPLLPADGDPPSALTWTPDGRVLALGTEGGRLSLC